MKQIRKIAAVHEFVHFIAIVYVVTVTGTAALRTTLLYRLRNTIQKLWGQDLLALYYALSGQNQSADVLPELTDAHFRIGFEGKTPDYEVLFLHFMFSRELFEEYFDMARQTQFKDLIATGENDNAIKLLLDTVEIAATDKDVPINTAKNQLFEWVYVYMR